MAEIKVVVSSVRLNEMFDKLVINLESAIPGIIRHDDEETGEVTYEKGEVHTIVLNRKPVVAQLANNSDEFLDLLNSLDEFTRKHWNLLLSGSAIVLERTFVEAGKEFPDDEEGRVAEHDCYSTKIKGLVLGKRAQQKFDEFMSF